VGDGCGGGGLGSQCGGDCNRNLCLKGRGGFGVSHPKRNKNCGLELAKAAATAGNEEQKDYLTCRRKC
jgi:hypothetical protein